MTKTFTVTMDHPADTRFLSSDREMAQILRYCAAACANAHTTGPQPNVKVECNTAADMMIKVDDVRKIVSQ